MSHQKAIDLLNQMAADLGLYGRTKHKMILWRIPRGWQGTKYYFGYTPWRTRDPETGQEGFFALKYRVFKNGRWKLVKSVRFGRRKVARERSLLWHRKYYGSRVLVI